MKILNLYAGVGGNRKLWENVDVTAVEMNESIAEVYKHYNPNDTLIIGDAHQYLLDHYSEFDFIWASPPCQSHSRARKWAFGGGRTAPKYPDMKLYQEILFLQHYFKGGWVIENVKPYYDPLIRPSIALGRHLFWTNFGIRSIEINELDIFSGTRGEYSAALGIDLSGFKISNRKDQVYRNSVHPETGLHILNCFLGKPVKSRNLDLFDTTPIT